MTGRKWRAKADTASMPSQRKSARRETRARGHALVSQGSQPGLGGWEGLPGEIIKSEGQAKLTR